MTYTLPAVTRPRRDGWTPDVQRRFLEQLALTGSPSQAAAAAGRSLQSAYKLRARVEASAFRDGWTTAITICMEHVRETAVERAFNGHVAPIIKYGRKVGERQVFNNSMLMSLMRLYDAPAYHADRARAELAVVVQPKPLTQTELLAQAGAILAEVDRMNKAEAAVIAGEVLSQPIASRSPSEASAAT